MTDDFKDHPQTMGELRSDKTRNALDWKPRDALIWLLREIDGGRIDIHHLIISWIEIVEPTGDSSRYRTSYKQAGGGDYPWDSLGLLLRVQTLIQESNTGGAKSE